MDNRTKSILDNAVFPKWAAITLEGKSVTPQQALEIIIRTDDWSMYYGHDAWTKSIQQLVGWNFKPNEYCYDSFMQFKESIGSLGLQYLSTDRIDSSYVEGANGWCDFEGKIYLNSKNIGKYADSAIVYEEFKLIAKEFPFLDFVCQIWSKEYCEEGARPVIEYRVKSGDVEVFEPVTVMQLKDEDLSVTNEFWMEYRNRKECTLEQIAEGLNLCLQKFSK